MPVIVETRTKDVPFIEGCFAGICTVEEAGVGLVWQVPESEVNVFQRKHPSPSQYSGSWVPRRSPP
jgi:hypothetical protein